MADDFENNQGYLDRCAILDRNRINLTERSLDNYSQKILMDIHANSNELFLTKIKLDEDIRNYY